MKLHSMILAVLFLFGSAPTLFADDLPSAKDPAADTTETEVSSPASGNTEKIVEKSEAKLDISQTMKNCMTEKNNKQLCAANAMAECAKSMSKADCKRAIKNAKR